MDVQAIEYWSRLGAVTLAGIGLVLAVWGVARWRPRRARRLCPGKRVRGVRKWNPLRLVIARPCGYDLSGLPADVGGQVRCPECGRQLNPRTAAVRAAPRWRPGRLGAVVLVMAAVVLAAPMSKTRSWQRYVPTTALIVVKRALGPEHTPTRLRRELDKRLARGGLYAWQVRMVIPALRRDLRDDKIMRSACRACEYLEGLGEAGRSALEASLSGPDHQERQMAAGTLQGQCVKSGSERVRVVRRQPTESLLRATVEGLASDTMDWNAWSSFEFLLLFPEPAKPFVVAGLESSDEQQQILCAALVAHAGHREHYDRAIPILTAHMADNRHCGDARLAGRALHWIGPEATGCLVALVGHGDPQQRAIATLLLRHMNDRPSPVFENELYNFVQTVLGNWPDDFGLSMGDLGWAPERLSGGGEVGRVGLSN